MTPPSVSPPVATTGRLVARELAGAYHLLRVDAPQIVAGALPGQFVSVGIEAPETLLRRPFAIAGVDAAARTLDLVIAPIGRGSRWLAAQPELTTLDIVGPMGNGFTTPAEPTRCVLVGGGYGVAALGWLATRLAATGHDVELLSGAASAGTLYPATHLDTANVTLIETTEDGGRGRTGLVTDTLTERVADDADATVFACGPMPMLAAVAGIAQRRGLACQVAVEAHMACSIGVCMTCVIPTSNGFVRACIDGPVMAAHTVDWSEVPDRHSGPLTHPPSKVLRDDRAPQVERDDL